MLPSSCLHGTQKFIHSLLRRRFLATYSHAAAQAHQLHNGCVHNGYCLPNGTVHLHLALTQRHIAVQHAKGMAFSIPNLNRSTRRFRLLFLKPS